MEVSLVLSSVNFPVIAWIAVDDFCASTSLQLEQRLMFVGRGVFSEHIRAFVYLSLRTETTDLFCC